MRLGYCVEVTGIENGVENTMIANIRSLMETLKMFAKQAMDALKIPETDQKKYEKNVSAKDNPYRQHRPEARKDFS